MSRTVIGIHRFGDDRDCSKVHEAVAGTPNQNMVEFTCSRLSPPIASLQSSPLLPGSVGMAGEHLHACLSQNPAVDAALRSAFDGTAPLYIDATSERPQSLPWEALRDSRGKFAALEGPPVARLVSSTSQPADVERSFKPPLRVLAMLGAAGVSGVTEARRLYEVLELRRAELPYRLKIVSGESALMEEVKKWNDSKVDFIWLKSGDDLAAQIESFLPHVLHFFCHGLAGAAPQLQLATRRGMDNPESGDMVVLEERYFQKVLGRHAGVWLVTLNCCNGAAVDGSSSLANRLVLQGYPVVVGMAEPIASTDASLFAGAFYDSLLSTLLQYLRHGDYKRLIEWAPVLQDARWKLCKSHGGVAADDKTWTLPVLHTAARRFELVGPLADTRQSTETTAALTAELQQLLLMRARLAEVDGIPAVLLAELDAHIEQKRRELAPELGSMHDVAAVLREVANALDLPLGGHHA